MATRIDKGDVGKENVPKGYEGLDIPDEQLPSCTVEDVDRALFELFDKQLPFQYSSKEGMVRVPVIFATGERFAILTRKKPLRDKNDALILPLISIMRTDIKQDVDSGMGPGQTAPLVLKRQISKDTAEYKRLVGEMGFQNADDIASAKSRDGSRPTQKAGRSASRRELGGLEHLKRSGAVLAPLQGKNIFEIIQMPPVKFFQSSYEIHFWAQYTQQMNDMISALMSMYLSNHRRAFKLETPKGYWFTAFVDDTFSSQNNADDFTDNERIVRYSFTVRANGYLINPDYPGAQSPFRRFVSAPNISFESVSQNDIVKLPIGNVLKNSPGAFVLSDLDVEGSEGDNQTIANQGFDPNRLPGSDGVVANVGGFSNISTTPYMVLKINPVTGEEKRTLMRVRHRNQRQGETVLKPGLAEAPTKLL